MDPSEMVTIFKSSVITLVVVVVVVVVGGGVHKSEHIS